MQKVWWLFKIHTGYSIFSVRNFSGVLNATFLLRKFSVSTRFVHVIVISLSGISVESYMLYYPEKIICLGGHRHSRLTLYWLYYVDLVLHENKTAQIPQFLKKSTYIWCIMPPHVFLCGYNNRGYKNEK